MPFLVHASPPRSPAQRRLSEYSPFRRFAGAAMKSSSPTNSKRAMKARRPMKYVRAKTSTRSKATTKSRTAGKRASKAAGHEVHGFRHFLDETVDIIMEENRKALGRLRKKQPIKAAPLHKLKAIAEKLKVKVEQMRHVIRTMIARNTAINKTKKNKKVRTIRKKTIRVSMKKMAMKVKGVCVKDEPKTPEPRARVKTEILSPVKTRR